MAAESKPYEFLKRGRVEGQHAIGDRTRLEFRCRTTQNRARCRECASESIAFRQTAQPFAQSILQSAVAEFVLLTAIVGHVATKRLWRGWQRRQHATIQQPWLLQPWWWRRGPFLRRTQAITFNH